MSTSLHKNTMYRATWLRLASSVLIGLGIVLVATVLEAGIFVLLGHGSIGQRLLALPAMVVHTPTLLAMPVGELLSGTIVVLLVARPLSLVAYLRAVHAEQEEYHQLYTPLKALTNIRQAAEVYQQEVVASTVTIQEEQVSILDLIQQQHSHQLILGVPGAGKTMALRVYQYELSSQALQLARTRGQIPVYVPMKNYSLFLKAHLLSIGTGADAQPITMLDFLFASDLPGMTSLRPYLRQLSRQGRLLLLCDGLNEIDSNYLAPVCEELVRWMRGTRNRLVMTCREVDFREQPSFVQMVEEGYASRAVIYPLQPEQVSEFVERYVERQDRHWQHTAGQILHVIDRSRLRYHCTNPMMLFTLMGIIDKIGVERGKQIDTRGRLLREYVRQLIAYEQRQTKWGKGAPTEREVVRFLSEVACAARWANDRNAIQLHVSAQGPERANFNELADELQFWLDEHPAQGPFTLQTSIEEDGAGIEEPSIDAPLVLQFALSSALVDVSPGGVLSFRHELIAEYFVAEYFYTLDARRAQQASAVREELLEDVGRWSEPIAIWAGLIENPLALAERFGALGRGNPAYVLQALALGLVCVGVLWTPPQAEIQRTVMLPPSIEDALSIAVRNRAARAELARIFTRCAEEGGQEVYRSLLPLLMVEGVDELLVLLDQAVVPEMLFTQLTDAIDNIAYEAQIKRLTRVLGRFGHSVVKRASQISLPAPGRSMRLRAAVLNILGGTGDLRAVEPLIARLSDADNFIVERATNALIRLGPELSLNHVLQELKNRISGPFILRVHSAALLILGRFLDEQDVRRQVSLMQFQHILDAIVPVLTSNYESEPDVQDLARELLVRQASTNSGANARDNRWERVIEALISYLPSQNEVAARNVILALREVGTLAIPCLLELLNQPSALVRQRVLEIIKAVRDQRALPRLLRMLNDSSAAVQEQVAEALVYYAPESISGLIDLVLRDENEASAGHAASILGEIGESVVEPLTLVLFNVVPIRTRLLVQVLEHIGDARCVSALITLLQESELETMLLVAIVRALSHFADGRVVSPLLRMLDTANPQIYEEAVDALSQLGPVALEELVTALDGAQETGRTQRVQRAILGMTPFPGERLVEELGMASDIQARRIIQVFKTQGADAALVLARNLLHTDEPVRDYVRLALSEMPGALVVPALLEALYLPPLRRVVSELLLQYPEVAIVPLVELLGERERGDLAAQILPLFGPRILGPLVLGLDDQRGMARELAQRIIVSLVRLNEERQSVLRELVRQLSPELPVRARDVLLRVLTNELADVSLPALLEGLEDAHLIEDVAEAFVLLARKGTYQNVVLENLVQALYVPERRRGAQTALASIGAPAVPLVGEMIIAEQPAVARVAREIMREIGVPALRFIWMAHSDSQHPERREAAMNVFHSMRTDVIKDELIALLTSQKPDDIAMAASLLLARIHDEAAQNYADRTMVSELVEYVQIHGVDETNLRVIGLLLLLGEQVVSRPLIQALDEYPQQRRQLIYSLLLLGDDAQNALLDRFMNAGTPEQLRAEIASVLGMVSAPDAVEAEAQKLSLYGLTSGNTGMQAPARYSVALRALGGLLAGGYWNARRLIELRNQSDESSPERELFNELLGLRYEPQMLRLREELQEEREVHKQETATLTGRIVTDQQRIQELDRELEQEKHERGSRSDELQRILQDNQKLRRELGQISQEHGELGGSIEQLLREKAQLQASLTQVVQERNVLSARLERSVQEKQILEEQNERLIKQSNQQRAH